MLPERQTLSHEVGQVKLREGPKGILTHPRPEHSFYLRSGEKKEQPIFIWLLRFPSVADFNANSAMVSESDPSVMDAVSRPCIRLYTYRTRSYKRRD
jgi:hypothetical protein